jgi:hypothetical protein
MTEEEKKSNSQQKFKFKEWITNFDNWKDLSKYGVLFTGGASLIANSWLFFFSQINADKIRSKADLSTYKNYGDYLKDYKENIQPAIGTFLKLTQEKDFTKYNLKLDKDKTTYNVQACQTLILSKTNSHTGMELFYSNDDKIYKNYRLIHNFYESLGFALKNDSINFETVFDLFVYPAYWDLNNPNEIDVTFPKYAPLRALRDCIGSHWFGIDESGKGQAMSDFSDNLNQLGYNYLYARLVYFYKNKCTKDFLLFRIKDNKPENPSLCLNLHSKIKTFEKNKNKNRSENWQKLYTDVQKRSLENLWKLFG